MDKKKYDAEYISYVETGESAAVFITRDVVRAIATKGKWIDVTKINGEQNEDVRWEFEYFEVELFPRKTNPVYPKYASDEDKKYITWQTAHKDIDMLRKSGYKGPRFKICPKLVNANKGKYKTVEKVWNKTFQQYVPRKWGVGSSCELRKVKVPVKPKWEYHIISIKRL